MWRKYRFHTYENNPIEQKYTGNDFQAEEGAGGPIKVFNFRFSSPGGEGFFADHGNFDNRYNREFLARLYWNNDLPTNQVAIVFNGLDETINQLRTEANLFALYDQMGLHLASHNVLTILLPTPYHLNRVMAYRKRDVEQRRRKQYRGDYIDFTVPTNALMYNGSNIYRNHYQGFKETVAMCADIRRALGLSEDLELVERMNLRQAVSSDTLALLGRALRPPINISLVGYSLGGLRALTEFLRDRYEASQSKRDPLFTACVSLNSGGSLADLANPPWVDPSNWKRMIDELLQQRLAGRHEPRFNGISKDERIEAEQHFAFLEDVFLGQAISINVLDQLDSSAGKNLLFITGGGDDLVPLEALSRLAPSGGLNLFQVAGMGHLFPYDPAWSQWKKVVFDVMLMFLETTARGSVQATSSDGLLEYLALIDHHTEFLAYDSNPTREATFTNALEVLEAAARHLPEKIFGRKAADSIRSGLSCSVARVGDLLQECIRGLLRDLRLDIQTKRLHPGAYRRVRRELLIGFYVVGDRTELIDSWKDMIKGRKGKIGELLKDSGFVGERLLKHALVKQAKDLDSIRVEFLEFFRAYVQRSQIRKGYIPPPPRPASAKNK